MIRLKTCVEKAVRPVRAMERRKDAMREELHAHLSAAFEEEFARVNDSDAAVEAAVRRFGDPAELTRELERSVPPIERLLFRRVRVPGLAKRCSWIVGPEKLIKRRPHESPVRHAVRVAAINVTAFGLLILALGVWIHAVRPHMPNGPAARTAEFLVVAAAATVVLGLLTFFFPLLAEGLAVALWDEDRSRRSRRRAALRAVLSSIVVLTAGLLLQVMTRGYLSFGDTDLALLVGFAVAAPLGMAWVSRLALLEARREATWGRLRIDT